MADTDSGEKTEEPTGKRLEDARDKGQIAKSPEFTTAAFLLGFLVILSFAGPPLWRFLVDTMGTTLAEAGTTDRTEAGLVDWLQGLGYRTILAMLGMTSAMAVIAIGIQTLQTGGLLTTQPLAPNFARLNPLSNAKKILSIQSFVELGKSLLKLGIVGWAVYASLADAWPDLQGLVLNPSIDALLEQVSRYGLRLVRNAGLMYLVLAAADYGWQRFRTFEDLKMTKQEVRDEAKQQEGNAEMKSRRRQVARERIRRAMFAAVPKADVVIVNPVHIAIAIKYDPAVAPAPYVVAVGERKIAQRIKELAFQAGVPVIENKPLARAMIKLVKVGTMIPVEMYLAVAEVLAFVMRQRERYGAGWRGTVAA